MTEEIADSGEEEVNIEEATEEISADLFPQKETEETTEEVTEKEEVTEEVKEEIEEKLRAAPGSWKKEMHEFWNGVDPAVQDYIEQRESEMKSGLDQDRTDANLGRSMRDVMTPYADMLKAQNVNELDAVKYMLSAHFKLTNAPEDQKEALAQEFLKSYGLVTDKSVSPEFKQLQDELNGIKSHLSANHEKSLQESHERVIKEVEKFASESEHSYFDEIADDIVPFLNHGLSLEDAYQKAIWTNPETRQKEIARLQEAKETEAKEKAKQEVQKAKKAKSTNVRNRDTANAPTEPLGSMEDTMHDTFREIQNR